jgi:hypothetical protein
MQITLHRSNLLYGRLVMIEGCLLAELEELKVRHVDESKSMTLNMSIIDGHQKLRRVREMMEIINYFTPSEITIAEADFWMLLPRKQYLYRTSTPTL